MRRPFHYFYEFIYLTFPGDEHDSQSSPGAEHTGVYYEPGHGILYAYPLTPSGNYAGSYVGIIFDGKLISDVYLRYGGEKKTRLNYAR